MVMCCIIHEMCQLALYIALWAWHADAPLLVLHYTIIVTCLCHKITAVRPTVGLYQVQPCSTPIIGPVLGQRHLL